MKDDETESTESTLNVKNLESEIMSLNDKNSEIENENKVRTKLIYRKIWKQPQIFGGTFVCKGGGITLEILPYLICFFVSI